VETPHRPQPDARRIDILNPFETPYWLKALDVTEHELLVAVDKVGTSAARVRRFLGEHPHRM
jgi:hypothetical protein